MDLKQFERIARAVWQEIPGQYKQGVDGLTIDQDTHSHPEHDEFFTLGECVTESYPSDFGGPDTTRSAVVLYYGSFRAVAQDDPEFDWEHEISETLLHELQHHLEHLADDDQLEDFDYAVEENFRRVEGEPFDPLFYRAGQPMGGDRYRVDDDVFIEVQTKTAAGIEFPLDWAGIGYRVAIPRSEADILYVVVEQEMPEVRGDLCIVRIRHKGMFGTLRAAISRAGYTVEQVLVSAQPR